jgi:hypothetical protein
MATNDELLISKLFDVEGLVAVITGILSRKQSLTSGGGTGIGLSMIPHVRSMGLADLCYSVCSEYLIFHIR